jgi:hypothetical protein
MGYLLNSIYTGIGVDLFVAQLRLYLSIMGISKEGSDVLIVEQFLRGIPATAAQELRSRCSKEGEPLALSTLIAVARHLPSLQAWQAVSKLDPRQ